MIHRLRGIGGASDLYVVPSVVAIGPYHHGLPHLQEMEEFKHAAAHWLCTDSGHTFEEVYAKVLSVTGEARRRYDDDDVSLAAVSDAEFATMMFLDSCFLVWFIAGTSDDMVDDTQLARRCYHSSGPNIFKDMFLLEN
nr:unnamed protein product [Digitaria exilis]